MTALKLASTITLLIFCGTCMLAAQAQENETEVGSPLPAVSVEVWPSSAPAGVAPKTAMAQWRAAKPPGAPQTLQTNALDIPAREQHSMARVAGVLVAPVTGFYAFQIVAPGQNPRHRPDETELWIQNPGTGVWSLAQVSGNPVKRDGRTRLEAGVAYRFELWSLGRNRTAVEWESVDVSRPDPATGRPTVAVARQVMPSGVLRARAPAPDDRDGDGILDSWKERHRLDLADATGPGGPWGDPDNDGLPNWQEQIAGTDPTRPDADGQEGLARWEIWRGIPGRYVFDLRRADQYPEGNRETRFLDRLEIPTGTGDQYGSRVRCLIKAPVDGEYTLHLIADDTAELWLGQDQTWQSKRLVAKANQAVGAPRLRWTQRDAEGRAIPLHPEQTARVSLKSGQQYYLEILHKQDSGQDHCAVAWVLPGAEKPELITARHLTAWKPCPTDTRDDGLPDEWQSSTGLLGEAVAPAMRHSEADPDGDGATNREEWIAGTNPLEPDIPAGAKGLLCESWTRVTGSGIDSLVANVRFPANPTTTTRIDNPDFRQEGANYGVRLRGYLTAPDTGDYRFAIAGNNSCLLYLADSPDKFTKQLVASVESGTNWRSFRFGVHQRSGALRLDAGKRYYIEVLYKRGANKDNKEDHSSIAWTRPGRKAEIIDPECLSPYTPDPRDRDDDDLPDEWETLRGLSPEDPAGDQGAWGDPDGDGLENFREFQIGLDPARIDVHGTPGLALWESWENMPGLFTELRDRDGLYPALMKDPRFPDQANRRVWRDALDAPRPLGPNRAARMRAHVIAPETGEYVFAIGGRDVAEFYLSPDASKFNRRIVASFRHSTGHNSWSRPGQSSKPVRLEAGKVYYIEALYARNTHRDQNAHFQIAWKSPGAETFQVITARNLIAFHRDPNDQDDDDLPDDWEIRHGLDSKDPRANNGPDGDPDRDGFPNAEELRLGTNPTSRDTDGDGISDFDEIDTYHTNPLIKDTIPPVEMLRFPLATASFPVSSPWTHGSDGSLTSFHRRGSLSFVFDLEKPGIYAVTLDASSTSAASYTPPVPLSVTVNGVLIGHAGFPSVGASRTWLTQWLPPGRHTVVVQNHNVRANVGITIRSLVLSRFEGKASDEHGIPQWLADSLAFKNQASTLPAQSAVSPAFIEGFGRFPKSVTAAANGREVAVHDHMTGQWFADIPLNPDDTPTRLELAFENGARKDAREIVWTPTNLARAPAVNHLRVGDSIRVTAYDEKSATFTLHHGEEVWESRSATRPITITFDQPGTHTLRATSGEGLTASVVYHVHDADFGAPIAVAAGGSRVWTPASVPAPLEIETEDGISIFPREFSAQTEGDSARSFRVTNATTTSGPRGVAARLPGHGPILATGRIDSFLLSSASKTGDHHLVGTLKDGTRVIEVSYSIDGPVPADLSIWIRLYVTDAVFSNGLTWLQLTAADFDETGVAKFRVYKAPGTGTPYVCHWILPYADFEDVLKLRQPR